ncbi:MAG: carboxylating nicotinate-nucleotide diphosphorylase [Candidatus Izemoplasmatales bacterium]|jgi:nicotinate-nucleotide pyrophosphorylase (carboxylating)
MDEIRKIVKNALKEDLPRGDISTKYLFKNERSEGRMIAKEAGIISGIEVIRIVFSEVDSLIEYRPLVLDGDAVQKGDVVAKITGPTKSLLMAERVALNILQRMSGIATLTAKYVAMTKGTDAVILDTRKTTPGIRVLEKMAVRHGGGKNHRLNLSEMVMLKDNHIKAAGSITEAVRKVRAKVGNTFQIEVEVENEEMFAEALETDCDIIMLDNMSLEATKACVAMNAGQKKLEASGNMTLERIKDVAQCNVDYISVGMITHSYKSLDISFKF